MEYTEGGITDFLTKISDDTKLSLLREIVTELQTMSGSRPNGFDSEYSERVNKKLGDYIRLETSAHLSEAQDILLEWARKGLRWGSLGVWIEVFQQKSSLAMTEGS